MADPREKAADYSPRARVGAGLGVLLTTAGRRVRAISTIRVTSFLDSGAGTLRQAVLDIPMNVEVRAAFVEFCKNKAANDYVFASPKTDGRLKCRKAPRH